MTSIVFGNATDRVGWQPSDQTRGTFDILSTCVLTMLLCVWTAVHLNVPKSGITAWGLFLRKVKWLLLGLLCPELLAITAWKQRWTAAFIVKLINGLEQYQPRSFHQPPKGLRTFYRWVNKRRYANHPLSEPPIRSTIEPYRTPHWTLVHGFFATMGGFRFRARKLHEVQNLRGSPPEETCFLDIKELPKTADGISRWVAPISEDDIKSMSKADGLAKGLVCLQVMWFLAQCLTRLTQHYPVSLLELNTFGHAACALLIYLCWWEKPVDIGDNPLVEQSRLIRRRALELMKIPSQASTKATSSIKARLLDNTRFRGLEKETQQAIFEYLQADLDLIMPDASEKRCEYRDKFTNDFPPRGPGGKDTSDSLFADSFDHRLPSITLQPGDYLPWTGWRLKTPAELFGHVKDNAMRQWLVEAVEGQDKPAESDEPCLESRDVTQTLQVLPTISLNELDVLRWRMAWGAPRTYLETALLDHGAGLLDGEAGSADGEAESAQICHYRGLYDNAIVFQCKDWDGFDEIQYPITMIGLSVGAFIYGGLHALAWYAIFDSHALQLLWRLSSCVVMGGFPLIFASLAIKNQCEKRYPRFKRLARLIPAPAIALYVLARAYLVIECFINLLNLPAGVYKVPNWTAYFPHIS